MKISQVVLYTWEIYFTPLAKLDSVKKMTQYKTDQKIFVIETLSSSGGFCVLVGRDNMVENFSSCCTTDNNYLNIAKQLEEMLSIYDKRLKGRKRRASTRINFDVISSENLVNQFDPPKFILI
jgi:hypothetical protein